MREPVLLHRADQRWLVVIHLMIGIPGVSALAWHADKHNAPRLQDPVRFFQQTSGIDDVFEHVVENRRVEAVPVERKGVALHQNRLQAAAAAVLDGPRVDVGTDGPWPKREHVADAAPNVDGVTA